LQNGQWQGKQIVSSDWLEQSTQKQIEKDTPATADYDYGYYWWIIPELNAFSAWGDGGNFVAIFPEKEMVVVLTSFPNSRNGAGTHLDEFMPVLRRFHNGAQ
jgi:CubicO group peptidase (beta-lactamase class C family)